MLFGFETDEFSILTDGSEARYQSGVRRDTVPYSLQLPGNQEVVDLRKESLDWVNLDFDDSSWPAAQNPRVANSHPYFGFEPRGIPMMDEATSVCSQLIGQAQRTALDNWEKTDNIAQLLLDEGLSHQSPTLELDQDDWLELDTLEEGGMSHSLLFDLGGVKLGVPVIEFEGAHGVESDVFPL